MHHNHEEEEEENLNDPDKGNEYVSYIFNNFLSLLISYFIKYY